MQMSCILFLVPPLFVLEFLHRACDTFEDYFGDCTESILKEHYVIVFEVKYFVTLRYVPVCVCEYIPVVPSAWFVVLIMIAICDLSP